MGLRHYVTHHATLLRHVAVHLPDGENWSSMIIRSPERRSDQSSSPDGWNVSSRESD